MVGRLRRPFCGFLLVLAECVAYFLSRAGCAWTVRPPDPQPPMATVILSQYGWHTRLAPPGPGGSSLIEYGFGNWRYYALGERSLPSGLRALFFSDTATLSRRPLARPRDAEWGRRLGSRRSVGLAAPADAVEALRQELERLWRESDPDTAEAHGLYFRRVDLDDSLFHNSNHRTAAWLERLGCEVQGSPVMGNFEVDS